MKQGLGPLNMPQKFHAQASPLRCARDEPWDISQNQIIIHAQVWLERGELIVGGLAPGIGQLVEHACFADVWQPDKSHVSDHLQLQAQIKGFGRTAFLILHGSYISCASKQKIAFAAAAALGDQNALADFYDIDFFAGIKIVDHCPRGHFENQVLANLAVSGLDPAVLSILGLELFLEPQTVESREIRDAFKVNISAAAATAAGWPFAHFDIAKSHGATAALSARNFDCNVVNNHDCCSLNLPAALIFSENTSVAS